MSPAQTYEMTESDHVGPHPSYIQLARQYISETKLQNGLKATGIPEAKEDAMRLHGVAWIDSVRKALKLPVRTFDTAVIYYHKFRLAHSEGDYGFIDAVAAAALFTACKVEDTLKRSRDILCAAHNLKLSPAEHLPADDARFEVQAKTVVGLERLMLESSAFDFRSTSPQRIVIKLAKSYGVRRDTVGRTAYAMSLDVYRTFAPMKQTSQTLAIACIELAGRLCNEPVESLEEGRGYRRWHTSREEVMETLQDLLDLYIHHKSSTIVGQDYTVESFIAIRIPLNQEMSKEGYRRNVLPYEPMQAIANENGTAKATNGVAPAGKKQASSKPSPMSPVESLKNSADESPSTPRREREARALGTVRFMLDGERAQNEKVIVDKFFKVEEEDYEVEVEVEDSKEGEREHAREHVRERERVREREKDNGWDRERNRAREVRDSRERDRIIDRFRDRDRDRDRRRP